MGAAGMVGTLAAMARDAVVGQQLATTADAVLAGRW
jgi:hypothetical protein